MKINHLDLFSGIGGFHLGFERAGFKIKSYFSEIDKHAIAVYKHKFKDATYVGSVTDVRGEDLPRIDLITFGSPCQDFSLAGKRAGMGGDRSSLILEAIRLVRECRPRVFIWENVKGAFSSNAGEDFAAILQEFADIGGYRLEWQLLNTSWFLPQNRERIYLVGYSTTAKRGWRGVFPIAWGNEENNVQRIKIVGNRGTGGQQGLIYGDEGCAPALNACGYKDQMKVRITDKRGNEKITYRANTLCAGYYKAPSDGDYIKIKQIGTKLDSNGGTQPYQQDRVYDADGMAPALNQGKSDLILRVKSATSDGFEEATSGDSINLSNPNSETRRGRVGKQKAQTLETSCNQAVVQPFACFGNNKESQFYKDVSKAPALKASNQTNPRSGGTTLIGIQANYDSKALNETIENSNLVEGEPQALDLYNRVARDESPTLTEPHHNSLRMFDGYRVRRLTPIECERLQGFPDDHTSFGNYDGEVKPMSNTQRYKQCGNAVTVNVVEAVAKKCIPLFKTNQK
jgi:DNA (cytosine-5)-methyltransferase 1